jgi:glucosamine-6-phosphate deaminase
VEVVVLPDEAAVARHGADLAVGALRGRERPVLLAATGTSPLGIYAELAARRVAGDEAFEGLRIAQLDEYLDLRPGDRRSLYDWATRVVAEPLGVPPERVIGLAGDGKKEDERAACAAYERAIGDAGGIDLAVLGLGPNGHLGFNEPPSDRDAPTRIVELAAASLESNARYWDGAPVPRRAITAGMRVIMSARRVLLVVLGEGKHSILGRVLHEPIGSLLPATWLRTHPAATLLADEAAMGLPR